MIQILSTRLNFNARRWIGLFNPGNQWVELKSKLESNGDCIGPYWIKCGPCDVSMSSKFHHPPNRMSPEILTYNLRLNLGKMESLYVGRGGGWEGWEVWKQDDGRWASGEFWFSDVGTVSQVLEIEGELTLFLSSKLISYSRKFIFSAELTLFWYLFNWSCWGWYHLILILKPQPHILDIRSWLSVPAPTTGWYLVIRSLQTVFLACLVASKWMWWSYFLAVEKWWSDSNIWVR